jgi:hypothetical protein
MFESLQRPPSRIELLRETLTRALSRVQVGASSGGWIAAFFTFVAFAVGFVMVAVPIPRDVAIGLIVVCVVLALISAYGAYRAHYGHKLTVAVFAGPRPRIELKHVPVRYALVPNISWLKQARVTGTGGLMLRNFGDAVARSASFSIAFPGTKWAVTGAITQITPDSKFCRTRDALAIRRQAGSPWHRE